MYLKSDDNIAMYLGLRYLPNTNFKLPETLIDSVIETNVPTSSFSLTRFGSKSLDKIFDRLVEEESPETLQVIPISAGLDSRTILAHVADRIPMDRILTITFGQRETFDYNYGQKVAKEIGVKNIPIELSPHNFEWEEAVSNSVQTYSRPTILFRTYCILAKILSDHQIEDYTIWSGFMGEAVAGSHLPNNESQNWEDAINYFLNQNIKYKRLIPTNFDFRNRLPNQPIVDSSVLSYDDQLDFGIRQGYFINPRLFFENINTPFTEPEWTGFMLNVPMSQRYNRSLFKQIVLNQYPNIFNIPTDSTFGLSLDAHPWRVEIEKKKYWVKSMFNNALGDELIYPKQNYFDMDSAIRSQTDFSAFVDSCLNDLSQRNVVSWIDIDLLLDMHKNRESNFGGEIIMLVSLELFLKRYSN